MKSTISLDDFIRTVQAYQKSDYGLNAQYEEAVKRRDIWDRLDEIRDLQTEEVVLKFLNQWKCRISYSCAPALTEALRESAELLHQFDKCRLEETDLDSANVEVMEGVFRTITAVKAKRRTVGATATSKILHLANPNFFVMFDKEIRLGYGYSGNDHGYSNFIKQMKQLANDVLHEYSSKRNFPIDNTFQSLAQECRSHSRTIPKLLDEYNWVKFNPPKRSRSTGVR